MKLFKIVTITVFATLRLFVHFNIIRHYYSYPSSLCQVLGQPWSSSCLDLNLFQMSRPPCFQLNNFCPLVESIYKGTPLGGRRIPYQGGLYDHNRTVPICGAALLTENYLVTAAICLKRERDPNNYFVMLGDHNVKDMTDGQEKFDVAEVKIHPGFSTNDGVAFNDIALIRLRRPARFSSIIGSVCLQETPGMFDWYWLFKLR